MTSYNGEDTAKTQNMLRRDAKRRQSRGAGSKNKSVTSQVNLKEVASFVPRRHSAELHSETREALNNWQSDPNNGVISSRDLLNFVANGIKVGDTVSPFKVVLVGKSASQVGLDGRNVIITNKGFTDDKGETLPMDVWTVTVLFSTNPSFGVKFDFNRGNLTLL
jgi:hypothetical protein